MKKKRTYTAREFEDGSKFSVGDQKAGGVKRWMFRLLLVFFLVPLWIFLRSVYRDRIGAFGCFDDCSNMMGGYFLLHGKRMFSQIFFVHMPSMAYISAAIQHITKPDSIYALIYQHRMFVIYFSIIADVFLTLRFGLAGFGFALLYETTKGFIFGDRFLAESLIVYPVIYLWGAVLEIIQKKRISPLDVWLSVIFTWFVLFSREPYAPLVLFLFGIIVWQLRTTISVRLGSVVLILLSAATILYFGVRDFVFDVFIVNSANFRVESKIVAAQNGGALSIVLYPLQVLFEGTWNIFHQIEAGLMVLLFAFGALFLIKTKKFIPAILIVVILTLANVRSIVPGSLYYATFHHIQWYGLVIFTVCALIVKAWEDWKIRWIGVIGGVFFLGLSCYAIVSPQSYIHEHVDRQTEFTTNYAQYYVTGEVVRRLSNPQDSLFLDGIDDLIYWQAERYSDYPYSWYTALMPLFPVFTSARMTMLATDPPVFFYGFCSGKDDVVTSFPIEYQSSYVRLYHNGAPSCLYVRKDKSVQITPDEWKSIEQFDYSMPPAL